ncbi:MAG: DUF3380 domain-containing protein [Pseudorhodoplanes sp.]|nr:DUF3380 domain-containing protein [Pseudorhodoplanes sp.]
MITFSDDVLKEVVAVAKDNGIETAALLAVVEIESAGRALEDDGKTPRLLFERHIFHRELRKRAPEKLARAVEVGLAIPKWNRAVQYKDQGTSRGRLAVLARARAIETECANRSCSWGVGQTMGFLAEEMGFGSATEMVNSITGGGIPTQVAAMVREIKNKKLKDELNSHNWAGFARVYNGPGYAANQYDTKMAAAYSKWVVKFPPENEERAEEDKIDITPSRVPEPPKSMAESKTGWAAIIGTITAVGTAVGQAVDSIKPLLSDPKVIILIVIIALATGAFIYWDRRRKLRQDLV